MIDFLKKNAVRIWGWVGILPLLLAVVYNEYCGTALILFGATVIINTLLVFVFRVNRT